MVSEVRAHYPMPFLSVPLNINNVYLCIVYCVCTKWIIEELPFLKNDILQEDLGDVIPEEDRYPRRELDQDKVSNLPQE